MENLSYPASNCRKYEFITAASGDMVPAILDPMGNSFPLHSTVNPRREAERLIGTLENEGFLVFFGLGGAFYIDAALKREKTSQILLIDFDQSSISGLINQINNAELFNDPRLTLLLDPDEKDIQERIISLYKPAIHGGIRLIPLRARTNIDRDLFNNAASIVNKAIEAVSSDFSVQAHFGKRWQSNIIHNLKKAASCKGELPQLITSRKKAAVCAAGPSLDKQLHRLKERECFIISTDTSLGTLLDAGIKPDAVISIDCQHIGYYHFMKGFPEDTYLFLDLVSPPSMSSLSEKTIFFSGNHPMARYVSAHLIQLPEVDISGGNVTYAAISLAEQLGAEEIELYGADFSFPNGISYARGTYIYPYFEKKQNRFQSLECQASHFLYRTELKKIDKNDSWYYESPILKFYREKLEEKIMNMEAKLIPAEGEGAKIKTKETPYKNIQDRETYSYGKIKTSIDDFLISYKDRIKNSGHEEDLLTTLLPLAAYYRARNNEASFKEIHEEAVNYSIKKINSIIDNKIDN